LPQRLVLLPFALLNQKYTAENFAASVSVLSFLLYGMFKPRIKMNSSFFVWLAISFSLLESAL
jgi:hypothetical protein